MNFVNKKGQQPFVSAEQYWQLEQIYIDLAQVKGKGLTPLEKKILLGLLCGYSPKEIAEYIYQSQNSSNVRVYLSNGIYKYIRELMIRKIGKTVAINNWIGVSYWLEKAGYKKHTQSLLMNVNKNVNNFEPTWEEKIDVPIFVGRDQEINRLKQLLIEEECRVVALLAMIGVGKTALAVKVIEQIQPEFDYVIWRTLNQAPPLEDILNSLLQSLGDHVDISQLTTTTAKISCLMSLLRQYRCLIVFNQFDSVLDTGICGNYLPGYAGYGELINRIATEHHSSCLLFTSREQPQQISLLEGKLVRCFWLSGLDNQVATHLLTLHGVVCSDIYLPYLVDFYANNPLFVKLFAVKINTVFNGDVETIINNNLNLIIDVRNILDEQFSRLSALEQLLMYFIAINQQLQTIDKLDEPVDASISLEQQLEGLHSLQRRQLINSDLQFTAKMLFNHYLVEKIIEQINTEINNKNLAIILTYVINKAFLIK